MNIEPIINGLAAFAGAGVASILWNLRRKATPISAPVAAITPVPLVSPVPLVPTVMPAVALSYVECAVCRRVVARYNPATKVCINCKPLK